MGVSHPTTVDISMVKSTQLSAEVRTSLLMKSVLAVVMLIAESVEIVLFK